jgi:hypothetical protein
MRAVEEVCRFFESLRRRETWWINRLFQRSYACVCEALEGLEFCRFCRSPTRARGTAGGLEFIRLFRAPTHACTRIAGR